MMKISFSVLNKHKSTLLFPIYAILTIFVLIFFCILTLYFSHAINIFKPHSHHISKGMFYAITLSTLFIIIFVGSLIITLSNLGVCHYTSHILSKKPISVKNSIMLSLSKIFLVSKWAALSAFVRIFVLGSGGNRNNQVASMFGSILKAGWSMVTFFVMPKFAFENYGLFESIKQSASLMKNTFGQSIVANISFSFIHRIIVATIFPSTFYVVSNLFNPIAGFFVSISTLLIILPITTTAENIFKVAVYNFATNKPTGPFDTNKIKEMFNK